MVTNMVNREKYMGTEDFKRSIEIIKNFINTYLNKDIQGFQDFDLDKEKTNHKKYVKSDKDILIPVTKFQGQWVALDGHTRLKLAQLLNIKEVYAYEEETDAYIEDFVLFCKEQQKDSIYDLPIISETEYEVLWNQFCENYFKFLNQEN